MRIIFFIAAVLYSFIGTAQLSEKTIDSVLKIYVDNREFSGVAYLSVNGKIAYHKSFGYKNYETKEKLSGDEVFQVGSVTKQFTAALILKLQEEGKLSVHDKITKYFPQYSSWDSIAIHNLLNHTSGIFNYTNISKFMAGEVANPISREKMINLFSGRRLMFSPGSMYAYSNSNYILLGYIIEDLTGLSYDKAVRKYIFEPLDMKNSGFDFANLPVQYKATGYVSIKQEGFKPALIVDSTASGAAGNIYSNVKDLDKWVHGLLEDKIINKESRRLMFTPGHENYGYGILSDSIYGKYRLSHGGGIHGFNSHLEFFPDSEISVILLSNVNTGKLQEISSMLSALAHGVDLPKEYQPELQTLKNLEGVYKITEGFSIDVKEVSGKLTIQATGQPRVELTALTDTSYYLKMVNARINFLLNESGSPEALELIQSGQRFTAIKMTIKDPIENQNKL